MSKFDTRMKNLCNPKTSRLSVNPEYAEEVEGHKFYPERGIFVKDGKVISLRTPEGKRLFGKTRVVKEIAARNARIIGKPDGSFLPRMMKAQRKHVKD